MSHPMEEAREVCKRMHGDLVSITSKDENVFIWKQVGIYWFKKTKQKKTFELARIQFTI